MKNWYQMPINKGIWLKRNKLHRQRCGDILLDEFKHL